MVISKDSRKIALSFTIVLGLSLAMIIFDLSRMNIMQSQLDIITNEHSTKSDLMMTIHHGIYDRQVSLRNIMLMDDPFERDIGKSNFNSYALNVVMARNKFSNMFLNEEEKILLKEINNAMVIAYNAQMSLIDTSIYNDEVKITQEQLQAAFITQKNFIDKVKQMVILQTQATNKAVVDAEQSFQAAKSSVYILGGSALLFGIFVAALVIRLTESQTQKVNEAMFKIEESNHLLEDRVRKRTEELSQVRDQALASSKSKDMFLANMSHELRTPLNIIMGYSELLEEVAEDEGHKKIIPDLNKIKNSASQLLELISKILDISKIENGLLEINPIDFDVEKLILEIETAAKPLMMKKDNTFVINCNPGIGMMYSDNIRIRQILLNLLSNAAKFTEQGTVSFNVYKSADGDIIEFEVMDTGVGIPKHYIGSVFEKFTQADSSMTRKYGGSGLGLAISKQLSEQLKGDLSVTSEEGKGTCFKLTLPIVFIEK